MLISISHRFYSIIFILDVLYLFSKMMLGLIALCLAASATAFCPTTTKVFTKNLLNVVPPEKEIGAVSESKRKRIRRRVDTMLSIIVHGFLWVLCVLTHIAVLLVHLYYVCSSLLLGSGSKLVVIEEMTW